MALNTKTPILLVVHRDAHLYKPKNRWTLSPRTIEVEIGPIIDIKEYDRSNLDDLVEETWKRMNQLL